VKEYAGSFLPQEKQALAQDKKRLEDFKKRYAANSSLSLSNFGSHF
jgi:hypothetical protein